MDIQHALTPELASRMAVTAVTTDIEYWARTACVDGHVDRCGTRAGTAEAKRFW